MNFFIQGSVALSSDCRCIFIQNYPALDSLYSKLYSCACFDNGKPVSCELKKECVRQSIASLSGGNGTTGQNGECNGKLPLLATWWVNGLGSGTAHYTPADTSADCDYRCLLDGKFEGEVRTNGTIILDCKDLLNKLRANPNGEYYLDPGGKFDCAGVFSKDNYIANFYGILHGNCQTIENLSVVYDGDSGWPGEDKPRGMIAVIGSDAKIHDLILKNFYISAGDGTGSLAGINNGTVENVRVIDSVVEGDNAVGGLVGTNMGTISRSSASSLVSGFDRVSSGGDAVGGLVGINGAHQATGTIENSYAEGSVVGDFGVGGLVGSNGLEAYEYSSSSSGEIQKVRSISAGVIINSYAKSDRVQARKEVVGGLVGGHIRGEIRYSFSASKLVLCGIKDCIYLGGLIGKIEEWNKDKIIVPGVYQSYYNKDLLDKYFCYGNFLNECGRSTSELRSANAFYMNIWDFRATWLKSLDKYPELDSSCDERCEPTDKCLGDLPEHALWYENNSRNYPALLDGYKFGIYSNYQILETLTGRDNTVSLNAQKCDYYCEDKYLYKSGEKEVFGTPISSCDQLWLLGASSESFYLANDLNCWRSYNNNVDYSIGKTFSGKLYGGCFVIRNLRLPDGRALFRRLDNATLTNINIENASTKRNSYLAETINKSTLTNIRINGVIHAGDNASVGMLATTIQNSSVLTNIFVDARIYANQTAGMISAYLENSKIYDSYAEGYIGYSSEGYDGPVTGGGLVGDMSNRAEINNSYFVGELVSKRSGTNPSPSAGGLVGSMHNSSINNSFASAIVKSTINTGALAGWLKDAGSKIKSSYFVNSTLPSECVGRNDSGSAPSCSEKNKSDFYGDSLAGLAKWDFNVNWGKTTELPRPKNECSVRCIAQECENQYLVDAQSKRTAWWGDKYWFGNGTQKAFYSPKDDDSGKADCDFYCIDSIIKKDPYTDWDPVSETCTRPKCDQPIPPNTTFYQLDFNGGTTTSFYSKEDIIPETCDFHCVDPDTFWERNIYTGVLMCLKKCEGPLPPRTVWHDPYVMLPDSPYWYEMGSPSAVYRDADDAKEDCDYKCADPYARHEDRHNPGVDGCFRDCKGTPPKHASWWYDGVYYDYGQDSANHQVPPNFENEDCAFHCDRFYTWHSGQCAQECKGTLPGFAEYWNKEGWYYDHGSINANYQVEDKINPTTKEQVEDCDFHCQAGFSWVKSTSSPLNIYGGECVKKCTGPLPARSHYYGDGNYRGYGKIEANYQKENNKLEDCDFRCNDPYVWNGKQCVTYCEGTPPANAEWWNPAGEYAGKGLITPNHQNPDHPAQDCDFHCQKGYEYHGEWVTDIAIRTCEDLININNNLQGHYYLDADIDCVNQKDQKPIGWMDNKETNSLQNVFSGVLQGNCHTISNVYIDLPMGDYVGLFKKIEGRVENLRMYNINIVGRNNVGALAGGLSNAGGSGTVAYVSLDNSLVTGNHNVGGLIGSIGSSQGFPAEIEAMLHPTVANYSVVGVKITRTKVLGYYTAGGIAGELRVFKNFQVARFGYTKFGIKDSSFSGYLISLIKQADWELPTGFADERGLKGGLVGTNWGYIKNSYANATAIMNFPADYLLYYGGIAGTNLGIIDRVYASGKMLISDGYLGGITSENRGAIKNSYVDIEMGDPLKKYVKTPGVVARENGFKAVVQRVSWNQDKSKFECVGDNRWGQITKCESSRGFNENNYPFDVWDFVNDWATSTMTFEPKLLHEGPWCEGCVKIGDPLCENIPLPDNAKWWNDKRWYGHGYPHINHSDTDETVPDIIDANGNVLKNVQKEDCDYYCEKGYRAVLADKYAVQSGPTDGFYKICVNDEECLGLLPARADWWVDKYYYGHGKTYANYSPIDERDKDSVQIEDCDYHCVYPSERREEPVDGTPISTCLQLQNIRMDQNYYLTSDIDCKETKNWNKGEGFIPRGSMGSQYQGIFNGNCHKIKNLYINSGENNVGFFAYIGVLGSVQKLTFENAQVYGRNALSVGGLTANNYGTIRYVKFQGRVGGVYDAGGLVGWNYGMIKYSSSTVELTGLHYVGGLVAANNYTGIIGQRGLPSGTAPNISESQSHGKVSIALDAVVDRLRQDYFIARTFFSSATKDNINLYPDAELGGLVGRNLVGGIENNFSTAELVANPMTVVSGGLVGSNDNNIISNSYYHGTINTAQKPAGGLIGENRRGTLRASFSIVHFRDYGATTGMVVAINHDGVLSDIHYYDNIYPSPKCVAVNDGSGTVDCYPKAPINYFEIGDLPIKNWDFERVWQMHSSSPTPLLRKIYYSCGYCEDPNFPSITEDEDIVEIPKIPTTPSILIISTRPGLDISTLAKVGLIYPSPNNAIYVTDIPLTSYVGNVIGDAKTSFIALNESLASRLEGNFLLAVESVGRIWVVKNAQKIYIPDGNSAYAYMRNIGTSMDMSLARTLKFAILPQLTQGLPDVDSDDLPDALEAIIGTDKNNPDSDSDGYIDSVEVALGFNPLGSSIRITNPYTPRNGAYIITAGPGAVGQAIFMKDGQAYYVAPDRGYEAMKYLSTGITNANLNQIPVMDIAVVQPSLKITVNSGN